MRILTGAAVALTTLLVATSYSAPAEARDKHRDGARHGHHHHHSNHGRRHRKGGLRIGIGGDGIYITKKRRHRHHRH